MQAAYLLIDTVSKLLSWSVCLFCAVVDNVFGADTAAGLREELAAVRGTSAMHKAS